MRIGDINKESFSPIKNRCFRNKGKEMRSQLLDCIYLRIRTNYDGPIESMYLNFEKLKEHSFCVRDACFSEHNIILSLIRSKATAFRRSAILFHFIYYCKQCTQPPSRSNVLKKSALHSGNKNLINTLVPPVF